MENLFYQLVHYLKKAEEIDLVNLFVDGTKIEANANRKKSTNKIKEALVSYPFLIKSEIKLKEYLTVLMLKRISFVHRRGRRKTQIQWNIELLTR